MISSLRVPSLGLLLASLMVGCGPDPQTVADQLLSDNPAVREDTARRAQKFNDPAVIQALIASLDDDSEKVRLYAIDSLIELKAVDAVPRLAGLMVDDSSEVVRRNAIDAIGRLADPVAVPALVTLLESTADTKPPLNAIWALGQMGDNQALAVLSKLRLSSDPYVSYNANQALRRLRPPEDDG
ncbi:MAG: HEAT repeat domain-containing protein [Oligoflexia bacterium]|nr:HEAT repeat domain-containing protein [Oligoflexia bacterium]